MTDLQAVLTMLSNSNEDFQKRTDETTTKSVRITLIKRDIEMCFNSDGKLEYIANNRAKQNQ